MFMKHLCHGYAEVLYCSVACKAFCYIYVRTICSEKVHSSVENIWLQELELPADLKHAVLRLQSRQRLSLGGHDKQCHPALPQGLHERALSAMLRHTGHPRLASAHHIGCILLQSRGQLQSEKGIFSVSCRTTALKARTGCYTAGCQACNIKMLPGGCCDGTGLPKSLLSASERVDSSTRQLTSCIVPTMLNSF